jgi:hypothetical protein
MKESLVEEHSQSVILFAYLMLNSQRTVPFILEICSHFLFSYGAIGMRINTARNNLVTPVTTSHGDAPDCHLKDSTLRISAVQAGTLNYSTVIHSPITI